MRLKFWIYTARVERCPENRKTFSSECRYDYIHHDITPTPDTLETLVQLYNKILLSGHIPRCWREAIVVAFLKGWNDPSSSASYRPIDLASCLCKLFEKMLNRGLVYFSVYNNIFVRQAFERDEILTINSSHYSSLLNMLSSSRNIAWRYA